MEIRGLELPDFQFPAEIERDLDLYLARCAQDSCREILHSGVLDAGLVDPEKRELLEILAGLRALRDPGSTPAVLLSALSFAYLLYHYRRLPEAFATLDFIARALVEKGEGTPDD